jgi:NDP-sugar pyrophosphorylase family protein
MKALLLAAGLGSRLGPITTNLPKSLVMIKNRPVIDYLICKLINLNINHIYINTYYKKELIINYIANAHYPVEISIIQEEKLLGTAGTLKNLIDKINVQDFLVMYADNYFEDNLINLKKKHLEQDSNVLVTMGTTKVNNPLEFGTVTLSDKGFVEKFYEKDINSPSLIANTAIYFMKPEISEFVKQLPESQNDISLHLVPKLIGKIKAEPIEGYFYDIGTPDKLKLAREQH